jgi:hypothetical protein
MEAKALVRFFAIHNAEGEILHITGSPADTPILRVALEPGQFMTEISLPNDTIDPDNPETYKNLLDVAKNFRVEVPTVSPAQIRRRNQT